MGAPRYARRREVLEPSPGADSARRISKSPLEGIDIAGPP